MKKAIILIVTLIAIGVSIMVGIDKMGFTMVSLVYHGDLGNYNYELQDAYAVFPDDSVVKYNKQNVQCFKISSNYEKKVVWQENVFMKTPMCVQKGDNICIYDKLGYTAFVYNKNGKVSELKATSPIIEADMNKNGYVSILQKENSKSTISIFDNTGKKCLDRISYEENGGVPITVALSDDNETFVSSYLDVSTNKILGKLVFFKIDGKELTDNLFASFEFKGNVITEVKYLNDEEIIAIADNKIIKINLFNKSFEEVEVDSKISKICLDFDDSIVLVCENKANQLSSDSSQIKFYNSRLKLVKEQIVYNKVERFKANRDKIIMGSGRDYNAYSKSGVLRWKGSFKVDVKQIVSVNNTGMIIVVNAKNAEIYRVQTTGFATK